MVPKRKMADFYQERQTFGQPEKWINGLLRLLKGTAGTISSQHLFCVAQCKDSLWELLQHETIVGTGNTLSFIVMRSAHSLTCTICCAAFLLGPRHVPLRQRQHRGILHWGCEEGDQEGEQTGEWLLWRPGWRPSSAWPGRQSDSSVCPRSLTTQLQSNGY